MADFNNTIDDLRKVGSEKPLGCLPLSKILEAGTSLENLTDELRSKHLETYKQKTSPLFIEDVLYAYDKVALQKILDQNEEFLKKSGWPTTTADFVEMVASVYIPPKTPLYDVVSDAFADYQNPNRLNVRMSKLSGWEKIFNLFTR